MQLSAVITAHNPDAMRLQRTLRGLRAQTLPIAEWETVVVDNASSPAIERALLADAAPANLRLVREPVLGLTAGRRSGLNSLATPVAVLVDDDNVLAPDYLAAVLKIFSREARLGAIGGKSVGDFAAPPPAWTVEFHPLLALRDLGDQPQISRGLRPSAGPRNEYPAFAPIGAGMALRRAAWEAWLSTRGTTAGPSDRRGVELSSGGDNDIVLCAMRAGWEVGYFPELSLTHLIPPQRLDPTYLARLNRGIQKSWMQVLSLNDANPWPPLSRAGVVLRKLKAFLAHRPWISAAAKIRWRGACGHYEGRVSRDAS
ncbi:MAG TPA: glycosyltransferase [Candidatus Didemnitutus sp.]|jgi:glycosyltransferase involved in cell wall biosynthesis